MLLRRCRVVVSGRVQGVGFRDACRREASRVGAAGFVRNLPDGSVEAIVEAEPAVVEQLIAWLRVGPSRAVVTGFTVEERSPEGGTGFSILV